MTELLDHYGCQYDKKGRMCCLFHEDKTPSMQVYFDSDMVRCFSGNCSKSGQNMDVIDFVMHMDKVSKHEAIKKCQELARAKLGEYPNGSRPDKKPTGGQAVPVEEIQAAFKQFQRSMLSSKLPKDYLESRGLQWKDQGIGYHPYKHRKADFLLGCVVWPLKDQEGQVVSLYGRGISSKGGHFYMTGRRGLFPGYPKAETKKLILTECIIDAMTLLQQEAIAQN